jgi:3-mercaptopyruvate sulfurtransferase SseA
VYCSVGYRSARIVERLRAAGHSDVRNLRGSIFQWANEGRPVVRGDSTVHKVHPFDATWGRLLNADLRADL